MTDIVGPLKFPHAAGSTHGVDLFRLTDAALIFSTLMMIAQRIEIWRRAQPLLAEYRAAKAAKDTATPAG